MVTNSRRVICALDTGDIAEAERLVKKLSTKVGGFKIGHALTLQTGLDAVNRLQDAGADRIFLDLKFHDIPHSVALAVREATKRKVWMTTLHTAGGSEMIKAAVQEAGDESGPLLMGVNVLTSIDQQTLNSELRVQGSIEDHMVSLAKLGVQNGLDGAICSVHELSALRSELGSALLVTPGIRLSTGKEHDQKRTADALTAIEQGADYLVIGRALTEADDPEVALEQLGLASAV